MTTPAEALERVREALTWTLDEHDYGGTENPLAYVREALIALSDLQAHIERLERERDEAFQNQDHRIEAYARDLQAAEARLARYEEVLLSGSHPGTVNEVRFTVVRDPQGAWLWRHDPLNGGGYRSERVLCIARAALADQEDGPNHRGDDLCRFNWKEHP